MPCDGDSSSRDGLLCKLKALVNQIDDSSCAPCDPCPPCGPCGPCGPCCPVDFAHAQVCFTCPPIIPLPTAPCPVKPLQMPDCSKTPTAEEIAAAKQLAFDRRQDNFYNYYNVHRRPLSLAAPPKLCCGLKAKGIVVDGKSPCCEPRMKHLNLNLNKPPCCGPRGCPTGFKPCQMRLQAPPCCNPIGMWRAEIQNCPPKECESGSCC